MALNHVLGKVPMIQVLDFMMDYMEYDCTVKEIIEHTGVGATDMKRDFPGLVECDVVVETRKIGGVQLYALNNTNMVTGALIDLDNVLSDHMAEKTAGKEGEEPEPEGHLYLEVITDANQTADDETTDDPKKYPESKEEWES